MRRCGKWDDVGLSTRRRARRPSRWRAAAKGDFSHQSQARGAGHAVHSDRKTSSGGPAQPRPHQCTTRWHQTSPTSLHKARRRHQRSPLASTLHSPLITVRFPTLCETREFTAQAERRHPHSVAVSGRLSSDRHRAGSGDRPAAAAAAARRRRSDRSGGRSGGRRRRPVRCDVMITRHRTGP